MRKLKRMSTVAVIFAILFAFSAFSVNADENEVYLSGQAFGVRFYADGAMIIKLEHYYDGQKYVCPARESGLKANDVIKKINNKKISTNEELKAEVENCGGKSILFEIERNGKIETKNINPIKNTVGVYLIGAWVRDSCAGIGTITYYDSSNNYFAALGHGICDDETSALLPLKSGEVVKAQISGAEKSICGKAGSLSGCFTEEIIGNLSKNTAMGVFGTTEDNFSEKTKYKIAETDEIKIGKALLYTTIEGKTPEQYQIEIKKLCNTNPDSNENFIIKITDERLLEKCGGIVQGMSGSPIVQNGKIVGAVTHVFVNNPKEGYGIFAQYMADSYK